MKEKILAFLKTKLIGVQEAFLLGVAENYSKTITSEDQIETTITDGVVESLKFSANMVQSEGDKRANEAQKTALKNFREKHNLDENGKPIENPTPPAPKPGEEIPAWAKTLQETVTGLSGTVTSIVGGQATAQKLESVKTALKAKGVDDKHLNTWAGKVNLDAEDLDAEIESNASLYSTFKQDFITSEVEKGNYTPSAGNPPVKDTKELEDIFNEGESEESGVAKVDF